MPPEGIALRDAELDGNAWWLPALDSLDASLGRLHRNLSQLDRDLRQARADYQRLVELNRGQVGNRLPKATALDVLTQQERRVAMLAACGHSNTELAAQLHVSVHTVKSQMCSILRKLDLRSRWELDRLLRAGDG